MALARFEFETGKTTSDGTKILLVEWEGDDAVAGDDNWSIEWPGKPEGFGVWDDRGRLLILLPPGAAIPAVLKAVERKEPHRVLEARPLPAIFPDARAGRRGVLHTMWATTRLARLDEEIAAEERVNSESVGLEMALQEKEWLTSHFGLLRADTSAKNPAAVPPAITIPTPGPSPVVPRAQFSPRLSEKLMGLKLATSDLSTRPAEASYSLNAVVNTGHAAPVAEAEEGLFALPMSPRSPDMVKSPFSVLTHAFV